MFDDKEYQARGSKGSFRNCNYYRICNYISGNARKRNKTVIHMHSKQTTDTIQPFKGYLKNKRDKMIVLKIRKNLYLLYVYLLLTISDLL